MAKILLGKGEMKPSLNQILEKVGLVFGIIYLMVVLAWCLAFFLYDWDSYIGSLFPKN